MMVMNTHCSSGVKEYLSGTLEQKVTRLSKLLVLALKTPPTDVEFNNILFASDFEPESHSAVDSVFGFAKKFKSKLSFLYVDTPQTNGHSTERKRSMGQLKKKYESLVSEMHIESANHEYDGILQFSEKFSPDLIAITTHNRQGLDYLIAGSRTDQILNESKKPVLIVPV